MQKSSREEAIPNMVPKCPFCGSFVDLYLQDVLNTDISSKKSILKYINTILKLPQKSSFTSSFIKKNDHRSYERNNIIDVKEGRMIRSPAVNCKSQYLRPRYIVSTKGKSRFYFEEAILCCDCTKTLRINPSVYSEFSYSERIGYEQSLTKIRHLIVNHFNRRP